MDEIDEIRLAYRKTLQTPLGGIVLYDLAEYCNFLESTTGDPYQEAKRDVFLHVLDMYGVEIPEVISAIQSIPSYKKESQEETDNG
jgi:hypothetical protein